MFDNPKKELKALEGQLLAAEEAQETAMLDEKEFETFCRLHAGFMYDKVTKISRQIGLACNLIFDDYKSSIDDIHPYDQYDEIRYDAKDLLLNKSTLSFYHT